MQKSFKQLSQSGEISALLAEGNAGSAGAHSQFLAFLAAA